MRSPFTTLAVVLSVLLAVHCYVLPTRELTFLWDDWALLEKCISKPAPARWFAPHMEHWLPAFTALFDAEYRLFGPDAWAFVIVGVLLHLANVVLLATLLRARGHEDGVAAVATAAFGLSTVYREVLWWPTCTSIVIILASVLVGLHTLERAREGGPRWVAAAALVAFVAPAFHGLGLVVAPLLAAEAALALPEGRRRRAAGAILAGLGAYLLLYACFGPARVPARLPATFDELRAATTFLCYGLGVGLVQLGFLVPGAPTPGAAVALSAAYVAIAGVALSFASPRARARVLVAHAFALAALGSVAAARWWWWQPMAMASSRYQYVPAIAWTFLIAAVLDAVAPHRRRLACGAGAALVLLLAAGGVRAAANEPRICAPRFRKDHADFVARLVSATTAAHRPVYDAPLPVAFPDRASVLVAIVAPGSRVEWTAAATAESTAPYRADPYLAALPDAKPSGPHGPTVPR